MLLTVDDKASTARYISYNAIVDTIDMVPLTLNVFFNLFDCHLAISILGAGGRYFFRKTIVKASRFKDLRSRITREVERSIDLALDLSKRGLDDVEIHLDISPKGSPHATGEFSEALSGYATGVGFDCKVKPDAWAALVADKHSK